MSAPREIRLAPADWERLRAMRAGFLGSGVAESGAGANEGPEHTGRPLEDYWRSRRDLEIYDATLGARIGWKWRAVIGEIRRLGIEPPAGTVLDFGCGTGVASRAWLSAFGSRATSVQVHDRSPAARAFALERLRAEFPDIVAGERRETIGTGTAEPGPHPESEGAPDVLLASHVLDELDVDGRAEFDRLVRASRFVVWVEPATKSTARELSRVRDALLDVFEPVAPCTHRARCGALAEGREDEWCHHFARPDPASFTTAHWRRFSTEMGVDLRALPYSYLVLVRRAGSSAATTARDPGLSRLIGRPEGQKGRLLLRSCDASGVRLLALLERTDKRFARALQKGDVESLVFRWRVDGGRITAIEAPDRAPESA